MPDISSQLAQINTDREAFTDQQKQLYALQLGRQKGETPDAASLTTIREQIDLAKTKLQNSIATLYEGQTNDSLVNNWEAEVPLLMLPVRIQTRIMFSQATNLFEVLVRIYPDDIFVCSHENVLTDAEVTAGKAYWNQIRLAEQPGIDKERQVELKKEAWRQLSGQSSGGRSLYVARTTTPVNRATLSTLADEKDMQFNAGAWSVTKPKQWSQATQTQLLPDRFQVIITSKLNIVQQPVVVTDGNLIPDTLVLGQDPLNESGSFKKESGEIVIGDEVKWMTDFTEAERIGMALRVSLPNTFYPPSLSPQPVLRAAYLSNVGVGSVVVAGVVTSADKTKGAALVEKLLEGHLYTRKSMCFLKQGTPTNNTDEDSSAWSIDNDLLATGYYDGYNEFEDTDESSDGARLASALGISRNTFQNVPNAGKQEREIAGKMNVAVSPATVGYYFEQLLNRAVLSPQPLLDFFKKYVTGNGSYTALGIGSQPYGIALAGDYQKYAATATDQAAFYQKLTNILVTLDGIWQQLSHLVPFVGSGTDPAQTLTDILSLHPNSVEFAQQWFYPDNTTDVNVPGFSANQKANNDIILGFLSTLGYTPSAFGGFLNFSPWIGNLLNSGNRATTTLDNDNIIKPGLYGDADLLDDAQNFNYLSWLAGPGLSSIRDLEVLPNGTRAEASSLLFLIVRQAFLRQLIKALDEFIKLPIFKADATALTQVSTQFLLAGILRSYNLQDPPPATEFLTMWEVFGKVVPLDESHPAIGQVQAESLAGKSLGDILLSSSFLTNIVSFFSDPSLTPPPQVKQINEFLAYRKTLGELAEVPALTLERNLVSHLDCVSHRLDAWQEGIIAKRIEDNRAKSPGGIYIGAFGWVENLKMSNAAAQTAGGFIHAPSIGHATTAAVLKSAFLNHKQSSGQSAFALNLHSGRLQRAQQVLEMMRGGERLEAVLGYQFERELNDVSVAKGNAVASFIVLFRQKYPIKSVKVPPDQPENMAEIDSTLNCVDGLKLAEDFLNNPGLNTWRNTIAPPSTSPALQPLLVTAEPFLQKAIANLADTLDAVKDLLSAETTYQMAQGNFSGSGATLDALKTGNVPHDLGILQPSRQNLMQFANRVTLHFDTGAAADITGSPRSLAEPGLSRWCQQVVGEPANIICTVAQIMPGGDEGPASPMSLADLNLQTLDFVCLAATPSQLENRIAYAWRKKFSQPDDVGISIHFAEKGAPSSPQVVSIGEALPLAATIQRLFSIARPVTAQDYLPNGAEEVPDIIDTIEFKARIEKVINELSALLVATRNIPLAQSVLLPDAEKALSVLGDVFQAMSQTRYAATADEWLPAVFSDAAGLQAQLIQIASYGVPEAFPQKAEPGNFISVKALIVQAAAVVGATEKMLGGLRNNIGDLSSSSGSDMTYVETLMRVGKQVFSGTMPLLPRFRYANSSQIEDSNKRLTSELLKGSARDAAPPEMKVEEWLGSAARVRPNLAHWETLRFMAVRKPSVLEDGTVHALDPSLDGMPVQVPTDALEQTLPDGTRQPIFTWIATEFPEGVTMRRDVVSIVATGEAAIKTDELQTGLLLDEWTEAIPSDEELSALTFHYNQPNAEAPQSMLLAVCPDDKWTWQSIITSVTETLRRAKLRTVDISKIKTEAGKPASSQALQAVAQMLPMSIAPVNVQQHVFTLDFGIADKDERQRMAAIAGSALGHYQIWQE